MSANWRDNTRFGSNLPYEQRMRSYADDAVLYITPLLMGNAGLLSKLTQCAVSPLLSKKAKVL